MKIFFLSILLLLATAGLVCAQAPDAWSIQLAMNEGLELEFPYFQEFADVQVVRGGQTDNGDFVFLCSGRIMWKLSSDEFTAMMQQEVDAKRPEPGEDDTLWRAVAIALSSKLTRIGDFQTGDTVTKVRFRVRLEQAGGDWIITDAKIRESDRNPLSIIDKGAL